MPALTVGLTGGIGSGKSAVLDELVALGAVGIDADAVARDVVLPGTPGFDAVAAAFGSDVVASDGGLDRRRLAAIVFADAGARARLEAITHPLVRAETERRIAAAAPDAIVVNAVPLLAEAGLAARYDVVVAVQAPLAASRRAHRFVSRHVRRQMRGPGSRSRHRMSNARRSPGG